MSFSLPLVFIMSVFVFWGMKAVLGNSYALDQPGARKIHVQPIPQIGGLAFGSIFLIGGYFFSWLPLWFIIGSLASLILGAFDDNFNVSWKLKLVVQLSLVAYLSFVFWDRFQFISFYNYTFEIGPLPLVSIFILWFVGIYNSVNLIDGLDGLAGGFIILLTLSLSFIGGGLFLYLNIFLATILISYLIFNQRPSKMFMGDSGSLFLGFYVASLPLLYMDLVQKDENILMITPFIILVTFLVADTTRVFFTRIASGKSPMTADTIHFHHLIIKNSGSYILTLSSIFLITSISGIIAIISYNFSHFSTNGIILNFAFLFLFVLTPPAPTYVKFLTKLIKPIYNWQKHSDFNTPLKWRTILLAILFFMLFLSILSSIDLNILWNFQFLISLILLMVFIWYNFSNEMIIPTLQIFICLLIIDFGLSINYGLISQVLTVFLLITILVFTFQKINGSEIIRWSALDVLITIFSVSGIFLSFFGLGLNVWMFLIIISLWISLGIIMRRIAFIK